MTEKNCFLVQKNQPQDKKLVKNTLKPTILDRFEL